MSKLADAEARDAMRRAAWANDWQTVVSTAAQHSSILVLHADRIAVGSRRGAGAAAHLCPVLRRPTGYILTNCTNPQDRLSTVEKAQPLLPAVGVNALIALGRPLGDGFSEFDGIGFDPLRQALGAVIKGTADARPRSTRRSSSASASSSAPGRPPTT